MENNIPEPSRQETKAVTMADQDAFKKMMHASQIGNKFAELYYSVLRTKPQYADEFYDEHGEYQTIFEDGSCYIARTRSQVKRILMQPMSASNFIVNSIISMPCGGTSGGPMVTVTGERFMQVFIMDYRPERMLRYAIVGSLTQYFSIGPAADNQTPITPSAADEWQVIPGTVHTPAVIDLDTQTPDVLSLNIADKTLPGTISNNEQTYTAADKSTITSDPETSSSITATGNIDKDTTAENSEIRKRCVVRGRRWYAHPPGIETSREPTSPNTTSNNIHPKNVTDNKPIRKHLFNLVLFSATCWALYKYFHK